MQFPSRIGETLNRMSQLRRQRAAAITSRRSTIVKLFCIVTIWGVLAWVLISPSNMSLVALDDFLINEKWREPRTAWKQVDPRNPLSSGRPSLMNTNVTFLGVGRNLGSRLPIILRQIEMLSNEFSYSRSIFVEGGSTDDTPKILKDWADRGVPLHNRTVITMIDDDEVEQTGYFKGKKMPREGRLSNARNVGLSELYRMSHEGVRTEYVIVIDLDVLGWDPYGVLDSFKKFNAWDVVCANGILLHGVYRDTYAFRTDTLNTNHHWAGNDEVMYNISIEEKKSFRHNLKVVNTYQY